jgi:hypothetical protein
MEPVLVVVYSHTGSARRLADLICSHKRWPLGVVTDAKQRAGGTGTLRCVLDSLLHRAPEIRYAGPPPGAFRAVILVAPIWMYSLAGPMRTFVRQYPWGLRRVGMLITMGSAGAMNAFREVERTLDVELLRSLACTAREVEDGSCTGRVLEMADAMARAAAPPPQIAPGLAAVTAAGTMGDPS